MIEYDKTGPAYAAVAMRANELMGQHIGMWPKKIELEHKIIDEEKQAESKRKVSEALDRFAVDKSNGGTKTPRLVAGGKT